MVLRGFYIRRKKIITGAFSSIRVDMQHKKFNNFKIIKKNSVKRFLNEYVFYKHFFLNYFFKIQVFIDIFCQNFFHYFLTTVQSIICQFLCVRF